MEDHTPTAPVGHNRFLCLNVVFLVSLVGWLHSDLIIKHNRAGRTGLGYMGVHLAV